MVTTVLCDAQGFMRPVETFWENTRAMACIPLHQNHMYPGLPPSLWSSLSELSEVLSPRLQSSFCLK